MTRIKKTLLGLLAHAQLLLLVLIIIDIVVVISSGEGMSGKTTNTGCMLLYLMLIVYSIFEIISRIVYAIWIWTNNTSSTTENIIWTIFLFVFATIAAPLIYWLKINSASTDK